MADMLHGYFHLEKALESFYSKLIVILWKEGGCFDIMLENVMGYFEGKGDM